VLYALLGIAVSHAPPRGIDAAARALAGHSIGLAELFTRSCLWYVFTPFCIALLVLAAVSRAWRSRAIFSVVILVCGWPISNELKNVFMRPRPDYWYVTHESTFAYSSGHAMFATIVYGLWAWYVWRSDLPRPVRVVVAPLLVLWACGIIWSRLALGAHYVTDVVGGPQQRVRNT